MIKEKPRTIQKGSLLTYGELLAGDILILDKLNMATVKSATLSNTSKTITLEFKNTTYTGRRKSSKIVMVDGFI